MASRTARYKANFGTCAEVELVRRNDHADTTQRGFTISEFLLCRIREHDSEDNGWRGAGLILLSDGVAKNHPCVVVQAIKCWAWEIMAMMKLTWWRQLHEASPSGPGLASPQAVKTNFSVWPSCAFVAHWPRTNMVACTHRLPRAQLGLWNEQHCCYTTR